MLIFGLNGQDYRGTMGTKPSFSAGKWYMSDKERGARNWVRGQDFSQDLVLS